MIAARPARALWRAPCRILSQLYCRPDACQAVTGARRKTEEDAGAHHRGFSTRARRNRDEVGFKPPEMKDNQTISRAGPTTPQDFEQVRQSRPENKANTYQIKRAARTRDWDAAWEMFSALESPDPLSYNAILHAADLSNKYTDAFQLFSQMREAGMPLSAVTFSPLIRLAGRFRKLDQVHALVEEMRSDGIMLNGHIFSSIIDAHKFAKDGDGAMKAWEEMKKAGIQVSEASLCSIMAALANVGDVARAEALLREDHSGMEPNIAHYNCLLLACRSAGDPESSRRFMQELKGRGIRPDVIAYTSLLASMRSVGRPPAELDVVLEEMAADGVRPDSFFLEEQLAYLASLPAGADLRAVRLNEQPPAVRERLAVVIGQAREAGMRLTNFTLDLEDRLKCLPEGGPAPGPAPLAAAASGADWVKVVTPGPAGGAGEGTPAEYYWDRASGRTQWERPPGPVTSVVEAA